jgi:hypothetical protein
MATPVSSTSANDARDAAALAADTAVDSARAQANMFAEAARVGTDGDSATAAASSDLVRALREAKPATLPSAPATTPNAAVQTTPTIVTETPSVVVAVHDRVAIDHTAQTARIVATPETTVSEAPFVANPITRNDDDSRTTPFVKPSIELDPAQLDAIDDGPSDGIIRTQHTADAKKATGAARRPPPGEIPVDDRPPQTTGEIRGRKATAPPPMSGGDAEPSILVADLQAAHSAVSAVAAEQATASSPAPNAAAAAGTPGTTVAAASAEVAKVRRDATGAFTQMEEEFFRAGQQHEQEQVAKAPRLASASDSFDDLDEGYERVGFWDRLLGRKKPR